MEVYKHQVGGHSRFLKLQDSSFVFKPYTETEYTFYEKLHSLQSSSLDDSCVYNKLKRFVPEFFGLYEIKFEKKLSSLYLPLPLSKLYFSEQFYNLASHSKCLSVQFTQNKKKKFPKKQIPQPFDKSFFKRNPFHTNSMSSLNSKHFIVIKSFQYIVLEDLVYKYAYPCVLDIKMGKRQRKVGASPQKEKRQLEKSVETTSHSLGFRLCGCQFLNKSKLESYDKYWGRSLTKEALIGNILRWFSNGSSFNSDLIIPLICKLKKLHSCMSNLPSYRFWSSSLLFVYDGGLCDSFQRVQSLRVKMIDFANTTVLPDNSTRDEDYLFGLSNIIFLLERFVLIIPKAMFLNQNNNLFAKMAKDANIDYTLIGQLQESSNLVDMFVTQPENFSLASSVFLWAIQSKNVKIKNCLTYSNQINKILFLNKVKLFSLVFLSLEFFMDCFIREKKPFGLRYSSTYNFLDTV
ncbi:inositol hexakisphosphate kinase 3-like [Hylaeus volcanicus]|uniref:inositol hexakisphosphate kinase 3-like n=1 Tax=Hylaeus volcanicus TaxID=313075 RepID=UPI0023B77D94|nr:inositol hexakisphosphate kinase 3-like [Hylaeus volcanicus]